MVNYRATSKDQEAHKSNFCLDCGSANETTCNECPKCGSKRHRAYLKPGEIRRG